MNKYLRSILIASITLIIIVVINFFLPRMLPGDPVYHLTGITEDFISQDLYNFYYEKLGLNLPMHEQLGLYLKSLFDGTLGYSYIHEETVSSLIFSRIGNTLKIIVPAILIVSILAIIFGLRNAFKEEGDQKTIFSYVTILFNTVPSFLIGMVLLILFSFVLKRFPDNGLSSPNVSEGNVFFDQLWHLFLPITSMVLAMFPSKYLLVKENSKKILKEKYVLFARTSGLNNRQIAYHYLLKNSFHTVFTSIAMSLAFGIGGSVVIENVFSINGMGLLFSGALNKQDFPLLQGMLFFVSLISVSTLIISDLLILIIDPKARRKKNV